MRSPADCRCSPYRFVLGCLLAAAVAPLAAAELQVSQMADSGPGSLRAAIAALPANEHNRIVFTAPFGVLTLVTSLPQLRGLSLEIQGAGHVIDGASAVQIFSAALNLRISRLTLRNGVAPLSSGCLQNVGPTAVEQVLFEGCRGGAGSGNAYGGALTVFGALQVRSSAFVGNLARPAGAGGDQAGGAIHHAGGHLRIEDSRFENNRVEPGSSGFSRGGAIFSSGQDLEILRSRFLGNQVLGLEASGGAVHCSGSPRCAVLRSYFGGNASEGAGGALAGEGSALLIENSTFYANQGGLGGAVYAVGLQSSLRLRASSFRLNETTSLGFGRQGGHLFTNGAVSLLEVSNSAFAATATGSACYAFSGSPIYAGVGYNLAVDASCAAFAGSQSAQLTPAEFGLGLPQLSGAVETLRLMPSSGLIDAGNPAAVGDSEGACPAVDSDGRVRPRRGGPATPPRCDVGASEYVLELFSSGFEAAP